MGESGTKSKNGREEDMKFISWNVNGIRACAQKGFMDIFNEADADIFCIQESKMQAGQLELDTPGYHQYWNYAERKVIPERQSLQRRASFRELWIGNRRT